MLIGLFWEVEHFSFYKPSPYAKIIENNPEIKREIQKVYEALGSYEINFEKALKTRKKQQSSNGI